MVSRGVGILGTVESNRGGKKKLYCLSIGRKKNSTLRYERMREGKHHADYDIRSPKPSICNDRPHARVHQLQRLSKPRGRTPIQQAQFLSAKSGHKL